MSQDAVRYVPGMRVELRDAEWRIDKVDVPSHGGRLLTCTGQSGLVRGRPGTFLTDLEREGHKEGLRILEPETTALVDDPSHGYAATQLRIHALLERTPPADDLVHLGHGAAMDILPYQLDPALQALAQTRPRILISDAVGLGKTLAAGILVSELIRRGRGKRILVLGVKSMLGQLQREFWQRFTIPLTRLDSVGLQRIARTIPTNHNPFHHIERAIISIDTLKQGLDYRQHLENCRWDIVVIDEAHNVARRGSKSQRHRLAELLSTRCDAMIMLSATPHDGRAESFASLIEMLDPTAIANPKDYEREDFADRGLVIRRLRKDVAAQMQTRLPERRVHAHTVQASSPENEAFARVRHATFRTLKGGGGTGQLFRTTLEKALLSSPAACLSTVANRLAQLERRRASGKGNSDDLAHDADMLDGIRIAVEAIDTAAFSKYGLLLDLLRDAGDASIGWERGAPLDRIVLFTESVKTLEWLEQHLPKALKLKSTGKSAEVARLDGGVKDVDQMEIVNAFNRAEGPLRLLLCSDVASEGLNLHHCSHRLVHFDIPWSLMVFQQRNGRVDRYGQTVAPEIHYLLSEAADPDVRGDQRVLQVLIEKDKVASKNLGDPSEFQSGDTVEAQEADTAALFERDDGAGDGAFDFDAMMEALAHGETDASVSSRQDAIGRFDPGRPPTVAADLPERTVDTRGVYPDAGAFLTAGLDWLGADKRLEWRCEDGVLRITEAPADLQAIARRLPREAIPANLQFELTEDTARIFEDMREARDAEDGSFGALQYLWPQHPVMDWLRTRVSDAFGRHAAPVLRLPDRLVSGEHWYLAHGGFPNRRGQALIQDHVAVRFVDGEVTEMLPLIDVLTELGIDGSALTNRQQARDCEPLREHLPAMVSYLRGHLQRTRDDELARRRPALDAELVRLEAQRATHRQQLELELDASRDVQSKKDRKRAKREAAIADHFREYERWLRDSVETEEEPYMQILAVITGDAGEPLHANQRRGTVVGEDDTAFDDNGIDGEPE